MTLATSGFKAEGGARHPGGAWTGVVGHEGPEGSHRDWASRRSQAREPGSVRKALGKKETLTLNPGSKRTFQASLGKVRKADHTT